MSVAPQNTRFDSTHTANSVTNDRLDAMSDRLDALEQLFNDPSVKIVSADSPLAKATPASEGLKNRLADLYDVSPRQAQSFKRFKHAALLKTHPDKLAPGADSALQARANNLYHRQEALFENKVAPNWDAVILTAPPQRSSYQPSSAPAYEDAHGPEQHYGFESAPKNASNYSDFATANDFVSLAHTNPARAQAAGISQILDIYANYWNALVAAAINELVVEYLLQSLLNQASGAHEQGADFGHVRGSQAGHKDYSYADYGSANYGYTDYPSSQNYHSHMNGGYDNYFGSAQPNHYRSYQSSYQNSYTQQFWGPAPTYPHQAAYCFVY